MASSKRYRVAFRGRCAAGFGVFLSLLVSAGCAEKTPPPEPAPSASKTTSEKKTPRSPASATRAASLRKPAGLLPRFTDVARAVGVDFERYDDQRGLHRIMEANGGGVAMFDFDANGEVDLFFTNGCKLPLKTDDGAHTSRLYANRNGTAFRDVTAPSRLQPRGYCTGCTVGDYNSDGFDDLYVAAYGRNSLWMNNGDGTFTDVTAVSGTAGNRWSSSSAFADVNLDGVLDLYVANYLVAADDPPKLCPTKVAPDGYQQCPPTMFPASDDKLYLGDGQGGFVDVTKAAGIVGVDGKGLGVAIFDVNGDRQPDIYVANDGMPNFLYLNRSAAKSAKSNLPPIRFEETAALYGAATNHVGTAEASMGVAVGDVDGDGWPDLFLTHFVAETNTFYRNQQGTRFEDETSRSGLGPPSRRMTGFGTMFLDFDNNGRLDLFAANGHVDDFTYAGADRAYAMRPQFFRNEGRARFIDVSPFSGDYFKKTWIGRGVATSDFDNDGDVDLAVSHQRGPASVLRNDTPTKHKSVTLRLVGTGRSNRSAFAAQIEATGLEQRFLHEVMGGTSFQSAPDRRIHIGLGDRAAIPRLEIRWPSGATTKLEQVEPGNYVLAEGNRLLRVPDRR